MIFVFGGKSLRMTEKDSSMKKIQSYLLGKESHEGVTVSSRMISRASRGERKSRRRRQPYEYMIVPCWNCGQMLF